MIKKSTGLKFVNSLEPLLSTGGSCSKNLKSAIGRFDLSVRVGGQICVTTDRSRGSRERGHEVLERELCSSPHVRHDWVASIRRPDATGARSGPDTRWGDGVDVLVRRPCEHHRGSIGRGALREAV